MSNAGFDTEAPQHYVGVATTRDLERSRRLLADWFRNRQPDANVVDVLSLSMPTAAGGSSETYFARLKVQAGAELATQECVLRIDPREYRLFLRENFDEQYRVLRFLCEETEVPVPAIRYYEPDASVLGSPFWIMERVDGMVPPDNPPYNAGGWVFEGSIEQRRRLWRSSIETLAKIARLDTAVLPKFLTLAPEETGLDENLRHWTDSMTWACDGKPGALNLQVNEWLWANRPARRDTGLSWGDARIGNMLFRDWECVAVLDWETITLAGPQLDLAHWIFMEDYYTECLGLERLPGFGARNETVALWEQLSGRVADQLDWHEVLAVFRININMARYVKLWSAAGRANVVDAEGETLISRHLRRVFTRVSGIGGQQPRYGESAGSRSSVV
jgi:aminoglycoside phosphotransferase (APT) family kinase protein